MRAEWDNHPAHAYIAPGTTVFHRHSGKSCFYGHGVIATTQVLVWCDKFVNCNEPA